MKSDLLGYCFSQFFNWIVDVVFYSFYQKTVTVRTVYIHVISCFLKVNTASLVTMNQNYQWIYLILISGCGSGGFKVLNDKERMVDIMVFINIHFWYYLVSFAQKLASLLINFIMDNVRVGKQPFVFGHPFFLYLLCSHFFHQIEVNGNNQINKYFPYVFDISDDRLGLLIDHHEYLVFVIILVHLKDLVLS